MWICCFSIFYTWVLSYFFGFFCLSNLPLKRSTIFKRIINTGFLLLGIVLLYQLFSKQDFRALGDEFRGARWYMMIPAVIFSWLTYYVRAIRWNLLIKPLGYRPSTWNSYHAIVIGYLANLIVPRLGEVSRCFAMRTLEKVPFTPLLGTLIVARVMDSVMMLFFLLITALVYGTVATDFFADRLWGPFVEGLSVKLAQYGPLLLIIGVLALIALSILLWSFRNSSLMSKMRGLLQQFFRGLLSIRDSKDKFLFILLSALIWILYLFSLTCNMHVFISADELHWYDALLPLMLTSLAMLTPVQAGIGAYHWMGTQAFLILGLNYTEGLAITTMVHLFGVSLFAISGVISLRLKGLSLYEKQAIETDKGEGIQHKVD